MLSDVSSQLYKPVCLSVGLSVRPLVYWSMMLLKRNGSIDVLQQMKHREDHKRPDYISRSLSLDASSHLYKRPCPSVGRLVGPVRLSIRPSVTLSSKTVKNDFFPDSK